MSRLAARPPRGRPARRTALLLPFLLLLVAPSARAERDRHRGRERAAEAPPPPPAEPEAPRPPAGPTVRPLGLVVLLTDFGGGDFYMGAIKGSIYRVHPGARVDEITHEVPPFDVAAGAEILRRSAPEYPPGTVFVCVVDPGVGTARLPIAARTASGHFFVGPDNGLMMPAVDALGGGEVRALQNADLFRGGGLSSTFHGRDVFGPVGAALARGVSFDAVGPVVPQPVRLESPRARREGDALVGALTDVDRYGNLLTNVPRELLEEIGWRLGDRLRLCVGEGCRAGTVEATWRTTYGEAKEGERVAVVGSGGVLEFAVNLGSLAREIGVSRAGASVRVERVR